MQASLGLPYAHTRAAGNQAGDLRCGISPDDLMTDIRGEVQIADAGSAEPLMSADGMATTGVVIATAQPITISADGTYLQIQGSF